MRVAIYCRLSDEDRNKRYEFDESESIQNQKNMLTQYVFKQGWQLYQIYCDEDFSGADADRPGYNQLLSDAENKRFDIVLCKTQSRFTRDLEQLEKYVHNKFTQWGIRFISIVDNADTQARGNKKARQINGLINEWYLEDVSENVKSVLDMKKRQGKFVGAFAPYGYLKDPADKNHLIPDPETRHIVQRIFDMYLKGDSLRGIAQILNQEDIPCPVKYKQDIQKLKYKVDSGRAASKRLWTDSSIHLILSNGSYVGDMVQGKSRKVSYKSHAILRLDPSQWIIVKNTHEAIISREQFDRVSALAGKRNRPMKSGKVSLFAGVLRCGECQSSLVRQVSRGTSYYKCGAAARNRDICGGTTVNEEKLADCTIKELRRMIGLLVSVDEVADLIEIDKRQDDQIENLEKQLRKNQEELGFYEELLKNIYIDKVGKVISEEEFASMKERLSKERRAMKVHVERLESQLKNLDTQREELGSATEGEKSKWKIVREYLNVTELTRDMVLELIDHIEIFKLEGRDHKKIRIYWRF